MHQIRFYCQPTGGRSTTRVCGRNRQLWLPMLGGTLRRDSRSHSGGVRSPFTACRAAYQGVTQCVPWSLPPSIVIHPVAIGEKVCHELRSLRRIDVQRDSAGHPQRQHGGQDFRAARKRGTPDACVQGPGEGSYTLVSGNSLSRDRTALASDNLWSHCWEL